MDDRSLRPFAREGLLGRVIPFGLAAIFGLLPVLATPDEYDLDMMALAGVITLVVIALALFVPWERVPPSLQAAPPILYLVAVALVRHAHGEEGGSSVALMTLPALWVALYGTRRELLATIGAVGLALALPIALIGPPIYRLHEWAHITTWLSVIAVCCLGAERLVRRTREDAQRHRAVLDGALEAMLVVTADRRVRDCNPRAEELLGFDRRRGGQRIGDGPLAAIDLAQANGDGQRLTIVGPDGRERIVDVRAVSIQFAGEPAWNVAVQDVTDRVRAEIELRASAERYRAGVASAREVICRADAEGRWTYLNQAWTEVSGFSPDETLGRRIVDFLHPDDRPRAERQLGDLAAERIDQCRDELRIIARDGEPRWVEVSARPFAGDATTPAGVMGWMTDVTERRRLSDRLKHLADRDPLTGVLNRRAFQERVDEAIANGSDTGVLILDLDGFKYVNDLLGHHAGDQLLVHASRLLQDQLEAGDVLARLGGDEFAVLLADRSVGQATDVARSLLDAIQNVSLPGVRRARPIATSIGIATTATRRDLTTNELLIAADLAMYDAKEAGGNRFAVHDGRSGVVAERVGWLDRVAHAIDEERFVLFGQRVVDLETGMDEGVELLVRLQNPDGSLVAPGVFLPVAERFDLVQAIDRFVLREALATCGSGVGTLMGVNVSARSIGDPELLAMLEGAAANGLRPGALVLELTETSAVADIEAARRFADHVRALGALVALDDFGAGFGTFYALKHLPFDVLKIDGEFVRECLSNAVDQALIESVVTVAARLGKTTVAECVEDQATLDFLRASGVRYAQGFHLGHPEPLADAVRGAASRARRAA